ncbi:tetratricopeptide repeat protein [Crocosphaera sp.]|uniref:tetratricopeptide repeat protein n=1 Tax=Crocosphaera sp. TaxID=2729996 RepID=UPI00261B9D4F|nr:tetratricopeptide repeat protein [Crocosphaera sp.]MDJ0581904.1 tetratricopeptide repeat protein [Crocosphaera sp.]
MSSQEIPQEWNEFLNTQADSYDLSERQKQVFLERFSKQISEHSNAGIATKLHLSLSAFERDLRDIYECFRNDGVELGTRTRGQAEELRKWLKQKYAQQRQSQIQPSKPLITTTAVIDTTLPPIDKWQGRKEEIKELETALDNDNIRLIGITAAGGYGKTALAVKVTEKLEVFWVNFNQPYSLAQFGRWLLEKLNQPYDEKWNEETLILQLIQGLIAEPCLLVLNNLETVLTAENVSVYGQFLSKWLSKGSNSKVLLTSREQPKFSPNLQKRCHWQGLKGLKPEDAIFLVKDYELTGTEEELAKFVNQMARHPLLINLVCSLMIDEFGEGVCVTESKNLGLDMFDVEGFHRDTETCVRQVVTASLARLSDKLGEVLKRLSVLRENFALELAQGVATEVTDKELRYLGRLSLLQEFPPEPLKKKPRRFQFLPLISMVVQQQAETEILQSAHQSALDYYQNHLPAPPWESLEDVTAYLEAFYHAGELREWQLAYDILNDERGGEGKDKSVNDFLDFKGLNRIVINLYNRLKNKCNLLTVNMEALNRIGISYLHLGEIENAIKEFEDSNLLVREKENDLTVKKISINSLANLGLCLRIKGDIQKAIVCHQKHLKYSQEIGEMRGIAAANGNLGLCYARIGKYQDAITCHHEHLKISENLEDELSQSQALGNIGSCYWNLGKIDDAIEYFSKQNHIANRIGYMRGKAISSAHLGNCYHSRGEYENAIKYQRKAYEYGKDTQEMKRIACAAANLGNAYGALGQHNVALRYFNESLDIEKKIGDISGIAISLVNIADSYIALMKYQDAENNVMQALTKFRQCNFNKGIAHGLYYLAKIAHKTDRPELALTRCQEALELSKELGIPLVEECEEILAEIQDTLEEDS